MLPTIILLYALDTGQIPIGCYIAAWVVYALEVCGRFYTEHQKHKKGACSDD